MNNGQPLRLLLVEDSEKDARLMVRQLERYGFQVAHRRVTGKAALEEALASQAWDAALLDHSLPGFSGPAAMSLILQRGLDIPLIVVSGTIGEELAVQCMKAGAHDYLIKGNLQRLGPALERELREAALRREKRSAEQAIQESAREWQITFDAVSGPVAVLDNENRFVRCNLAMQRFLDMKSQEIIGRTCGELVAGLSCNTAACPLCRMWETGTLASSRQRLRGRWFEITAERVPTAKDAPLRAVLQMADITDIRLAEEHFHTLFDGAADAVFILDFEGGLLEVNTEACTRLGYDREELQGLGLQQLLTPEHSGLFLSHLEQLARQGQLLLEIDYLARDGRIIPSEISSRIIELQERQVILCTARDLSKRRRAERERDRLQSMVQQSQKLEAIGQLAAGVAHDFNNMLTAIQGYSHILLSRIESEPEQGFVRKIEAACHRAAALTQRLLTFGRKEPFNPKPMELNGWLRSMEDFFNRLLRGDIKLVLEPAPEPLYLQADEARLEQVLLNLLANARDAMPDGGRINISTSRQERSASISVSDTGCGMDEITRARIFEPFFTTKPSGEGTGLGLPVVWGIVRQHQGSIEVESRPGQGTTFRVLLPLGPHPQGLDR